MKRKLASVAMVLLAAATLMMSAGCASQAEAADTNIRAGIHPEADLVQSGPAPSYSPAEPGRIYVYDATENERLGIYYLSKGDRFVLDPKSGRATIEGNEVVIDDVDRGHFFHIYFESDADAAARGVEVDRSITVYKEDPDATRDARENRNR